MIFYKLKNMTHPQPLLRYGQISWSLVLRIFSITPNLYIQLMFGIRGCIKWCWKCIYGKVEEYTGMRWKCGKYVLCFNMCPKFMCWKLNAQCNSVGRWSLKGGIRSQGSALMNRLMSLSGKWVHYCRRGVVMEMNSVPSCLLTPALSCLSTFHHGMT